MWLWVVLSFIVATSTGLVFRSQHLESSPSVQVSASCSATDSCGDTTGRIPSDMSVQSSMLALKVYISQTQSFVQKNVLSPNTTITPDQDPTSKNVTPGITYNPKTCNGGGCFRALVGGDGSTVFITGDNGFTFSPAMLQSVTDGSLIVGKKSGAGLDVAGVGFVSYALPATIADGDSVVVVHK